MNQAKSSQSLSEVHKSVDVTQKSSRRKFLAFLGPAYLVSVGYMDPGNWATDLAGGSQFGYKLIWVLLMSNLIAQLLQNLCVRLGVVRNRDLAQASREIYPTYINLFLYFLAEIAIAACDLAEVLGMAIGLNLLFGLPLIWGVMITVLDTFLLLFLMNLGIRKMEAFIIALVAIIGLAFFIELFIAQPSLGEIAKGFVPTIPNDAALYIAIGIIGATVMPHNLYLHSSLVQTRKFENTPTEIKKALRFNLIDTTIALNLAFFVNAAILILAAATFYKNGMFEVAEIHDAHKLLAPVLGNKFAPILFAVALIASGQSSTVTGTLAGQIVMEGYLNIRIAPWIRRIITRLIAIVPALITIHFMGDSATGKMLVLSQVILSLQLGFAVIPLIHFVSDKKKMKEFTVKKYVQVLAWISALIIVVLNVKLVHSTLSEWMISGMTPIKWLVLIFTLFSLFVLVYITFRPLFGPILETRLPVPHQAYKSIKEFSINPYQKIALAVDFSDMDEKTIQYSLSQGGKNAEYKLIHVVETAGAFVFGKEVDDFETQSDIKHLENYTKELIELGYNASATIGYGNPRKEIVAKTKEFGADLLVMGAHGHQALKDILLGTSIDAVRHELNIPVLVVK
ncbi:MAG: Nramp family divalent metal transporter [Saprospiraceae bacterium]